MSDEKPAPKRPPPNKPETRGTPAAKSGHYSQKRSKPSGKPPGKPSGKPPKR